MAHDFKAEIGKLVIDIVSAEVPDLFANALGKLREQLSEEGDTVSSTMLGIVEGVLVTHGEEAARDVLSSMLQLIEGKPAAHDTELVTARQWTALVDALQTAEAQERATARKWATTVGKGLREAGTVLLWAAKAAVKG